MSFLHTRIHDRKKRQILDVLSTIQNTGRHRTLYWTPNHITIRHKSKKLLIFGSEDLTFNYPLHNKTRKQTKTGTRVFVSCKYSRTYELKNKNFWMNETTFLVSSVSDNRLSMTKAIEKRIIVFVMRGWDRETSSHIISSKRNLNNT